MGWQDAPAVGAENGPAWQQAPKVGVYEATAKSDSGGTNMMAAIGGVMTAPYLGIRQLLGNASPAEIDEYKKSMAGLWSTPMGKVGTVAGGVASALPAVLIPGANTALGAGAVGAAFNAMQPVGEGESRLANAALGAAGGVAGKYAGDAIGKGVSSLVAKREANLAIQQAQNLERDAPLKNALDAGFKIAPNEAGQQSALQWVGGQIKTQQTMASKNVPTATRLAAQDVGLPAGPITRDALDGVREAAGQAYDPVAKAGTIAADAPFKNAAAGMENAYNTLTQSFKSLKSPETETLLADLKSPAFDAEGIVEAVKRFRSEGFANLASPKPGDKALGRLQLQAQDQLEALIDRHLTAIGQPDAVSALQAARTTIAKTYSIQNALDANGNVIASKLTNQMTRGKPLTDNLQTIAQSAAAFPKSMQHFTANPPAFSALDMMAALMTGGKEAAMLGARPVARGVLASGPYQRSMMPNYRMSGLFGAAPDAVNSPATQAMLRALGVSLPAEKQ